MYARKCPWSIYLPLCTVENIILINPHLDPALLYFYRFVSDVAIKRKENKQHFILSPPPKNKCMAAAVGCGYTFECVKVNSTNWHLGVSFTCGGKHWGQSRQGVQLGIKKKKTIPRT